MRNTFLLLLTFLTLRASGQVVLSLDLQSRACTAGPGQVVLPVRVSNFQNIGGVQFTLTWDEPSLDFVSISPVLPPFTGPKSNSGVNMNLPMSQLSFIWSFQGGMTAPDGSVMFNLTFNYVGPGNGPVSFVTTGNPPVSVDVTDKNGDSVPFVVSNGGVTVADNAPPSIGCPQNVASAANGPVTVPGIALASVSDNCGNPAVSWASAGATLVANHASADASGSTFNLGISTVTYTATDIGGNTATCSFTVDIQGVAPDTLTISMSTFGQNCQNHKVSIPVRVKDFTKIGALQFSVSWNKAVLDFDSVSAFHPALQFSPNGGNEFNLTQADTGGRLAFAWSRLSPGGKTLADNAVLFRINFTAHGVFGEMSPLTFGDFPAVREAYTAAVNPDSLIFAKYVNGKFSTIDTQKPVLTCPQNASAILPVGQTSTVFSTLAPTTTDNCGSAAISFQKTGPTNATGNGSANGTYQLGQYTVTYKATDPAGNSATCSFSVSVTPQPQDTLTLSMDNVQADCSAQLGDTILVPIRVSGFDPIVGLQFNVEWDPTVLSILELDTALIYPGFYFNNFPQFYQDTASGLFHFLASTGTVWPDVPDGDVLMTLKFVLKNGAGVSDVQFTSLPPSLAIEAYNSNLDNVMVQTVDGFVSLTVDTDPPVLIGCPTNITLQAPTNECSVHHDYSLDVYDDCGIASFDSTHIGRVFTAGSTIVTYTATDKSGKTTTCQFEVFVQANVAPLYFGCPKDTVLEAASGTCMHKFDWKEPLATDPCGSALTDTSDFQSGAFFLVGTTTVHYTATNANGLTVVCAFDVVVRDTSPPNLICPPNDITLQADTATCSAIADWQAANAADACTQNVALTSSIQLGDTLSVGSYTVVYTATDDSQNSSTCSFKVTVPDTHPIHFAGCPKDTVIMADKVDVQLGCGAQGLWNEPTLSSTCGSAGLTILYNVGPGDFLPLGTTLVRYDGSSTAGSKDSCLFKVTVVDMTPPTFTAFPQNIVVNLPAGQCDAHVQWADVVATDICGQASVSCDHSSTDLFQLGVTNVECSATDTAGNSFSQTFQVTVNDVTPPVLHDCPPNMTVQAGADCKAILEWATTVTATDDCDQNPQIFPAAHVQGDTLAVGFNQLKFVALDQWGNKDSCQFTVDVQGMNTPAFANCPPNLFPQFGCESTPLTWPSPTAIGFCNGNLTVDSNFVWGTVFPAGISTVLYTATNGLGDTAYCKFLITVVENMAPDFDCPGLITVDVAGRILSDPSQFLQSAAATSSCDGAILTFGLPSATDNCTANPVVTQISGLNSGGTFPLGTSLLTFKAEDSADNSSICSVAIVVVGLPALNATAAPAFGCLNEMVVLSVDSISGGAHYTWTGPQQQYPDAPKITIFSLNSGNEGLYTVSAEINGCKTQEESVTVVLIRKPNAVDDQVGTVNAGEAVDSIVVLDNDIISLLPDAVVTPIQPLPAGVTFDSLAQTFAFAGAEQPGVVQWMYRLCSKNCPDSCDMAKVTLVIKDSRCVFFPNIITPNEDGINDDFYIPCLDANQFQDNSLVIYNQWGDRVFAASPYINGSVTGWKGTEDGIAGRDLPDGTYYYIFRTSNAADAEVKKGFVEIFR